MRILSLPICKSEMGEHIQIIPHIKYIKHIFYPLLKILDICIACTYLYNIVHYYYPKNHQKGEPYSSHSRIYYIPENIWSVYTHTHTHTHTYIDNLTRYFIYNKVGGFTGL